jgi:RNA polymerase-associated protein CTR9
MEGPKRPFDIPLGDSEVVTIDLDNLDADPADLLAALEDARCPVWYWTKLAAEHWRAGARQSRDDDRAKALDTAERIGNKARERACMRLQG